EVKPLVSKNLDASLLGWAATVVRNWRDVFDGTDVDASGCKRADSRLAAASGASDTDLNGTETGFLCLIGRGKRSLLSGERSAFARATEPEGSGTGPGEHVADGVGKRNDGVVKRSLNVNDTKWNVLLFLLFE